MHVHVLLSYAAGDIDTLGDCSATRPKISLTLWSSTWKGPECPSCAWSTHVRRGPVSIPSSQRAGKNCSEVVVRARQSCKLQRPRCNSRPMRSAEAQQAVTYRYVAASLCMKSGSSASARDRIGLCVGLAGTGSAPRATCSRPCMDLAHDTGRRKRGAASVGVKVTGSLRLRSRGHWQVRAWGLGDCGGMCASTPGPVVAKKPPGALDGARERV
jgi:hypothetical protein